MPLHLMRDAGIGLVALVSPWLFGVETYSRLHILLGIFEISTAVTTSTRPVDRAVVT